MIKSQDVISLWEKSGVVLARTRSDFTFEGLHEYELLMARLTILCEAHHGMSLGAVIRSYIKLGWISCDD